MEGTVEIVTKSSITRHTARRPHFAKHHYENKTTA
jgi:hypothetical protein